MRRLVSLALIAALGLTLAASPLSAKTFTFKLGREATINGKACDPGKYKLKLNGDNEALIYKKRELVTKARVEVKSRARGSGTSVLFAQDGAVREIRFGKTVVVFVR